MEFREFYWFMALLLIVFYYYQQDIIILHICIYNFHFHSFLFLFHNQSCFSTFSSKKIYLQRERLQVWEMLTMNTMFQYFSAKKSNKKN